MSDRKKERKERRKEGKKEGRKERRKEGEGKEFSPQVWLINSVSGQGSITR